MGKENLFDKVPDMFGLKAEFRFQQGEKSESKFGKIFTICLTFFMIFLFFWIGKEMVNRKQPKTNVSNLILEDPKRIGFTPDTFAFGIGLQDGMSVPFIDERIYKLKMYYSTLTRGTDENGDSTMTFTKDELLMVPCTTDNFGNVGERFASSPLDQIYCLSLDQPVIKEIDTQGIWESDFHSFLEFSIDKCDNSTSEFACASTEEITSKLTGGMLQIILTDTTIDPVNHEEPNFRFKSSFFTTVGANFIKSEFFYVKPLELTTDNGFLVSDYSTESYIGFDHCDDRIDITPQGSLIVKGEMKQARNKILYERSYMKLTDVIAILNGLFATLYVIIFVALKPFLQVKFYESLINDIFEIKHSVVSKLKTLKSDKSTHKETKDTPNGQNDDHDKNNKGSLTRIRIPSKFLQPAKDNQSNQEAKEIASPDKTMDDNSVIDIKHSPTSGMNNFEDSRMNLIIERPEQSIGDNVFPIPPTFSGAEEQDAGDFVKIEMPTIKKEPVSLIAQESENNNNVLDKLVKEEKAIPKAQEKQNEEDEDETHKNQVQIGFFEYMCSAFIKTKSSRERFDLLNEGTKKINKRLDIFNLMKKMREIDKLKAILFDENQLALFEYLPKPILFTEKMKESKSLEGLSTIRRSSFDEAGFTSDIAYNYLHDKQNKTEIDIKLMKNYEQLLANRKKGVDDKF